MLDLEPVVAAIYISLYLPMYLAISRYISVQVVAAIRNRSWSPKEVGTHAPKLTPTPTHTPTPTPTPTPNPTPN